MHKKQITYIVPILLILLLTGCSTASRLRKADQRYEAGEYYAAAERYRKVQNKISSQKQRRLKAEVSFKMGDSYRRINNHRSASRAFTSAIRYKYDEPLVYLYNAKSLHAIGNYKDAATNYAAYLQENPTSLEALAGLRSTEEVATWKTINSRYKIREANEFKSRRNSDMSPMYVDAEGESLVFTSNREVENNRKNSPITGVASHNIFTVRKNNSGKWESPSLLEGAVNTPDDEGVVAFSPDGKTLYFTRAREEHIAAEIYRSSRSGGEWTEAELVTLFPDSSISVAHPAITPNGDRLYFVSDAPGGYGGKDIWYVEQDGSSWGYPINAGGSINTAGDEMFPYFRQDGTLYFSSNGHPGFGGLDIFKATQDSLENWTVQNMLHPINSSADDFGITFEGNNERGYMSSNRDQRRATDRLFYFELPPLVYAIQGVVRDEKGDLINDATVRLVGNNGDNVKLRTKKDGSYRIILQKGVEYVMMASSRGYLNQSGKMNTLLLDDSKDFNQDFQLASISKPVKMDNIFYEFGKWNLTPESEEGLNALIKLLNDNPNIAIEISAHTDMVGTESYNIELSQKRAQSVVDYLIKAGVDKGRLTPKGYGPNSPVTVDVALAKKYRFLKDAMVLTPELILTLTPEQQEVANQINRRTEFKVIKTTYNLY